MFCRFSANQGGSWSTIDTLSGDFRRASLAGTTDNEYAYVVTSAAGEALTVNRFSVGHDHWGSSMRRAIVEELQIVKGTLSSCTDVLFEPDDPFLFLSWMAYDSVQHRTELRFSHSRDMGNSFSTPLTVATHTGIPHELSGTSIAAAWSGETEELILCAAMDRLGSPATAIRFFSSDDFGSNWNEAIFPDSSGDVLTRPQIVASGGTLMLTYSAGQTELAAAQLRFTYSFDFGGTFAPVSPIPEIGAHVADHVMRASATHAYLYQVVGELSDSNGTIHEIAVAFATPWSWSEPTQVNETRTASYTGGISASTTPNGAIVAWTAPFVTGDTDIRYDAAWRGLAVEHIAPSLTDERMLCYPNPFNGRTTLRIVVAKPGEVILDVSDLGGRVISARRFGYLGTGVYDLSIDLSAHPSGIYMLHQRNLKRPVKLVLTR